MNSQALHPPPSKSPQSNLKASSTLQSSRLSAPANPTPDSSRSSSQIRLPKSRPQVPKSDYVSRKATFALIRRVLAPETSHGSPDSRASPRPIEDLLPPLTSSNEVDVELYAIVAIIVKDFVNSWYSKITPDHTFVEEVIQIIAHCTRALEQRLRRTDVPALVLDEIPALVNQHVHAFRMAKSVSTATAYASAPIEVYHSLNPHPALSPVLADTSLTSSQQVQNELAYRQMLVQSALAVLLPTEDLENACLRTLVGDIVADLILGQAVAGKVCQGWFLHDAITKVVEIVKAHVEPKATGGELQSDTRSRLEKFGLLSSKTHDEKGHSSAYDQSRSSALFWRLMQHGYLIFLFIGFFLVGMSQARFLPRRSRQSNLNPASPIVPKPLQTLPAHASARLMEPSPQPVLTYRIFGAISTLLNLSTRMPWLASSLVFGQYLLTARAGRLGSTNSLLDKFLYNSIQTHMLPPTLLPPLLLNLHSSLFPNNALGPPAPPPPSLDEQLAIRRHAAEDILSLMPPVVARVLFGTRDEREWVQEVEEILDCFGDAKFNKYLVYGILELVVVRLVPEMEEMGWSSLLGERGVDLGGGGVGLGLGVVREKEKENEGEQGGK